MPMRPVADRDSTCLNLTAVLCDKHILSRYMIDCEPVTAHPWERGCHINQGRLSVRCTYRQEEAGLIMSPKLAWSKLPSTWTRFFQLVSARSCMLLAADNALHRCCNASVTERQIDNGALPTHLSKLVREIMFRDCAAGFRSAGIASSHSRKHN